MTVKWNISYLHFLLFYSVRMLHTGETLTLWSFQCTCSQLSINWGFCFKNKKKSCNKFLNERQIHRFSCGWPSMLMIIVVNWSNKFLFVLYWLRKMSFLSCPAHTAAQAVPTCTRMHCITKTVLAGSPKFLSVASEHFFYLILRGFQ